jgi:hypothetical protein
VCTGVCGWGWDPADFHLLFLFAVRAYQATRMHFVLHSGNDLSLLVVITTDVDTEIAVNDEIVASTSAGVWELTPSDLENVTATFVRSTIFTVVASA